MALAYLKKVMIIKELEKQLRKKKGKEENKNEQGD
jgi:ribosome-associated translation inhibitor RaiA